MLCAVLLQLLAPCLRCTLACDAFFILALVVEADNQEQDEQHQKDDEYDFDNIEDFGKQLLACLLLLSFDFVKGQYIYL